MDRHINIGVMGVSGCSSKTLNQAIRDNLEKELKKTLTCSDGKHKFIDAHDGTGDKECVICGVRAKQAAMRFGK